MVSKSSKWELGFVHYIPKFTISRFIISRFECNIFWDLEEMGLSPILQCDQRWTRLHIFQAPGSLLPLKHAKICNRRFPYLKDLDEIEYIPVKGGHAYIFFKRRDRFFL